jgi:hypothetical protein
MHLLEWILAYEFLGLNGIFTDWQNDFTTDVN